ncbi:tetratricopeptide repeat protein [Arcobacter vandammei]|uniref:tetratricopeptide repeat protein n=1 Tax=Arcobacter vandammei TaxID=2782243 RepID=UPI0018DFB732|nr:tetratricopeptide repeat protein [Arcobacter vandammei]
MKILFNIFMISVFLNGYTLRDEFFKDNITYVYPDENEVYHFDIDNNGIIDSFNQVLLYDDDNNVIRFDLEMRINNKDYIININTVPADFRFFSMYKEGYMTLCKDNPFIYNCFNYKFDYRFNNWFVISETLVYKATNENDDEEYIEHRLKIGEEIQIGIDDKMAKIEGKNTLLSLINHIKYLFKINDDFNLSTILKLIKSVPLQIDDLSTKTLTQYNDIAYYLQQANANDEAIFLLEKIIEKYPNRTVAYLNIADAYLGKNDKEKAKQNYEKYIELMKQDNKEEKIPKRVLEFLNN